VREALTRIGVDAQVHGVLCFTQADLRLLGTLMMLRRAQDPAGPRATMDA
jgi:hypothetical protein